MRKLSLLLAFCFVYLFSVTAQENDGKNVFLGVGVKGNVFVNNDAQKIKTWTKPSLAGDLFLGKWFSHKVGGRLFFEGGTLHPFFQSGKIMVKENYVAGRADFLLNVTNLDSPNSSDRFYNFVPYVGIGGAYAFNAVKRPDNKDTGSSLMGAVGLLNTFRLSNNL